MNGLCIQWGICPGYNGAQTVSFPVTTLTTAPMVVATLGPGTESDCAANVTELTPTFCKIDFATQHPTDTKGGCWIAIGY